MKHILNDKKSRFSVSTFEKQSANKVHALCEVALLICQCKMFGFQHSDSHLYSLRKPYMLTSSLLVPMGVPAFRSLTAAAAAAAAAGCRCCCIPLSGGLLAGALLRDVLSAGWRGDGRLVVRCTRTASKR
jgi:hypothetical protein